VTHADISAQPCESHYFLSQYNIQASESYPAKLYMPLSTFNCTLITLSDIRMHHLNKQIQNRRMTEKTNLLHINMRLKEEKQDFTM